MRLNLPIVEQLADCQNILLAGMGGGFDIVCGLAVYFELLAQGKRVHLANYSFSFMVDVYDDRLIDEPLVGITADAAMKSPYFPELYLAQWFREVRQEEI